MQVLKVLQNNLFFIKLDFPPPSFLRYIMLNKNLFFCILLVFFFFSSQQAVLFWYVFSSFSPVKFMSIYLKEKNIGKTEERKSDYTYGKL